MPTTVDQEINIKRLLFIKSKECLLLWTYHKTFLQKCLLKIKNVYYCRHSTWNIIEANSKFIEVKMSATVQLKGCEYNGNL